MSYPVTCLALTAADLAERDGLRCSWTEVERFARGGRTWVRLTVYRGSFCRPARARTASR